ncbi:MAG: response regulator [Verrucomicrobia bacterium]|nr:response regulator [Verrucomicrobiota bacterium]
MSDASPPAVAVPRPAGLAAPPVAQPLSGRIGKVCHDLRNPLSDILGFSEILQEEALSHGHFHLVPEFQEIYQTATQILKQVNQCLDLQHLKAQPAALEDLRKTTTALANRIIATAESLSQKCVLLEDNIFGDDLLRITGSTRKLGELTPLLLATITVEELARAPQAEAAGAPSAGTEFAPASAETSFLTGTEGDSRTSFRTAGAAAAASTPPVTGKLLVVEDNETNRALLTRRLRRQGYQVSVAENGRQALHLLRARPFDLVLLDIMMPEMDGYEVLERIKLDEVLRHLPVIMISGLDDLESLVRCIQRGAEDYLTKPFDPVLLGARIGACLEKKRLRDQEQVYLKQLQSYLQQLQAEQEKSERLLLNVLPRPIADRLKQGESNIADHFQEVTVLFADLVSFTAMSSLISPREVVSLLNEIFSAFDLMAEKRGLEKIKTIGDCYMAVGGLPTARPDHAEAIAELALNMLDEVNRRNASNPNSIEIRIGINTGSVIAGVIGKNKFIYDLWGDTVNTASRMEAYGLPGCVQVTQATYERLQGRYDFEDRGAIEVKGKGQMKTYFLRRKK